MCVTGRALGVEGIGKHVQLPLAHKMEGSPTLGQNSGSWSHVEMANGPECGPAQLQDLC